MPDAIFQLVITAEAEVIHAETPPAADEAAEPQED